MLFFIFITCCMCNNYIVDVRKFNNFHTRNERKGKQSFMKRRLCIHPHNGGLSTLIS